MNKLIIALITFISLSVSAQTSLRCPVCPPKQGDATNGDCLTIVNGQAVWAPCGGGGNSWDITGNSNATPTVNFIGTTSKDDLKFKVNDEFAGILSAEGSYVSFGRSALSNYPNIGQGNTAIGNQALNIVGLNATNNTSVGFQSGVNLIAGTENTFIGRNSGPSVGKDSINRSTALGYNAKVGCDTCVSIGDSIGVKVGIRTAYPTAPLHVKGAVRIEDGTQSNGYVLTSDANGVGSWRISQGSINGSYNATGTATSVFNVTIPTQADANYIITVTPTDANSATPFYVTLKDVSSFSVVYLEAKDGDVNFDWVLFRK